MALSKIQANSVATTANIVVNSISVGNSLTSFSNSNNIITLNSGSFAVTNIAMTSQTGYYNLSSLPANTVIIGAPGQLAGTSWAVSSGMAGRSKDSIYALGTNAYDSNDGGTFFIGVGQSSKSNITTAISSTKAGVVCLPQVPYAKSSCGTLISGGSFITLDTYQVERNITRASNYWQVQVGGVYMVGWTSLGNSGSGSYQPCLYKNGAEVNGTRTQDTNSSNDNTSVQIPIALAAGDYIQFYVVTGASHNNAAYNTFYMYLIG